MNNLYFRVYQLPVMVGWYTDFLQRTVCKWNHCSLRVDNIVMHFYDDWKIPKWITLETDKRMYKVSDEIYVGDCDIVDVRNFTNNFLPPFTKFDQVSRHLWYYSLGLWPKRNDCVDKCSATLTYLYGIPRCYSTPDKLYRIIEQYASR